MKSAVEDTFDLLKMYIERKRKEPEEQEGERSDMEDWQKKRWKKFFLLWKNSHTPSEQSLNVWVLEDQPLWDPFAVQHCL